MWTRSPRCSTEIRLSRIPCVVAAAALLTLAASVAVPAESESDGGRPEPAAVASEILADPAYQGILPGEAEDVQVTVGPGLGKFAEALLWVVFAGVVVLMVLWLVNEFGQGTYSERWREMQGDDTAGSGAEDLLEDPERLAAEGRLDEATHMLLLLAIRRLSAGLIAPPGPASTSRELLSAFPLSGERKAAFRELVSHVEWSLFGGRPVGPEEFARCREYFRTVVDAA